MKRRAAITAASAVTLAVLGGGIAVAAGSGLFGSPHEPGAGRLAPVLDPVSVSATVGDSTPQPDPAGPTLYPTPIEATTAPRVTEADDAGAAEVDPTTAPAPRRPAATGGETAGRDDGSRYDESDDEDHGDEDSGDDAKQDDDDAAEHEFEGHDDDD